MASITTRGFGDEAAASRKTRRLPDLVGVSKTGKSARNALPEKPPGRSALGRCWSGCTAMRLSSLRVLGHRLGRLGLAGLVADAGRQAHLLADPVVPVCLERVAQL